MTEGEQPPPGKTTEECRCYNQQQTNRGTASTDCTTIVCNPASETSGGDQTSEALHRRASTDLTGTPTQTPCLPSCEPEGALQLLSSPSIPPQRCACDVIEDDEDFQGCVIRNLCYYFTHNIVCWDTPPPPKPVCCAEKSNRDEIVECLQKLWCSHLDGDFCHENTTTLSGDDFVTSLKDLLDSGISDIE